MENLENAIAIHRELKEKIALLKSDYKKERLKSIEQYDMSLVRAQVRNIRTRNDFERLQMEVSLASSLQITKEEAIDLREKWLEAQRARGEDCIPELKLKRKFEEVEMALNYEKELGRLHALEEEAFQNTKRDFFNNAIGVVEPTVVVAKAGSIKKIQATIHDIESKNGNKS